MMPETKSVDREEMKLNVLKAEIATDIGGRIKDGFKEQNEINEERMDTFKPANSSTLTIIIVVQTLVILGLAYVLYKKPEFAITTEFENLQKTTTNKFCCNFSTICIRSVLIL